MIDVGVPKKSFQSDRFRANDFRKPVCKNVEGQWERTNASLLKACMNAITAVITPKKGGLIQGTISVISLFQPERIDTTGVEPIGIIDGLSKGNSLR